MKHVFIINPTAGKRDATVELMEMAKGSRPATALEVECILTKRAGHAAETARSMAQTGRTCGSMPAAATAPSTRWPTASWAFPTPP